MAPDRFFYKEKATFLTAPDQPNHYSLDVESVFHVRINNKRSILWVSRVKFHPTFLKIIFFNRGFVVNKSHDCLSIFSCLLFFDNDLVSIQNPFINHRIALNPKHKMIADSSEQIPWNFDRLVVLKRLNRLTGSDPTRIPFGPIFAPIVAAVVTWSAVIMFTAFADAQAKR